MPDPDLTPDGTLGALVTIVSQAGGEVGISCCPTDRMTTTATLMMATEAGRG
jgi:hypothetical protein